MLKPPTCVTNDSIEDWTELSWGLFKLLSNPAVAIAVICIVGSLIAWSFQRERMRRWVIRISFGLIALAIALPQRSS